MAKLPFTLLLVVAVCLSLVHVSFSQPPKIAAPESGSSPSVGSGGGGGSSGGSGFGTGTGLGAGGGGGGGSSSFGRGGQPGPAVLCDDLVCDRRCRNQFYPHGTCLYIPDCREVCLCYY